MVSKAGFEPICEKPADEPRSHRTCSIKIWRHCVALMAEWVPKGGPRHESGPSNLESHGAGSSSAPEATPGALLKRQKVWSGFRAGPARCLLGFHHRLDA